LVYDEDQALQRDIIMRKKIALLVLLTLSCSVFADSLQEVDAIVARSEEPLGVVFEVVQSREAALEWAIPQVTEYAQKLRARFPQLKIAVVTHGREQFSLLKENSAKYKGLQSAVRDLVKGQDIPVHVCGTHASWFEKQPENFPDYVDVAPSGPAQIRGYRELGYVLVKVQEK